MKKSEQPRYYAMTRLGECGRVFVSAAAEMPVLRRKIEKHRTGGNIDKAKERYKDLQHLYDKLLDAIVNAKLFLS